MPNIERHKGTGVVRAFGEQQQIIALHLMPLLPAIETAKNCRDQLGDLPSLAGHYAAMVPRAIEIMTVMLPDRPAVEKAEAALRTALCEKIAPPMALALLTDLLRSLAPKAGENGEGRLSACVSMFDEIEQAGAAIGMWKAIPNQPAVLVLAIERLKRTSTFQPVPCELREACRLAHEKLEGAWRAAGGWLTVLDGAEELLRQFAPAEIELRRRRRPASA